MQENEMIEQNQEEVKKTKKKKTTKKNNKKFKTVYLVPVVFVLVAAVVFLTVYNSLFNKGPIYGDRCSGVTTIEESVIDGVESAMASNESIEDILIEINCKTIAIDLTVKEGTDKDTVSSLCEEILLSIDEKVGLSKSNSESKYSDLFGTYNGKTQYHVDFTIEGSEDIFPIFASKHPLKDRINYTYQTARNEELAEKLRAEADAPEEDESTDE